jgi:hypothetical protein
MGKEWGPAVYRDVQLQRIKVRFSILTSSTSLVVLFFHAKCRRPSSPFESKIAPLVGSQSTIFVPSLLKARPALNPRRGSDIGWRRMWEVKQTRRVSAPKMEIPFLEEPVICSLLSRTWNSTWSITTTYYSWYLERPGCLSLDCPLTNLHHGAWYHPQPVTLSRMPWERNSYWGTLSAFWHCDLNSSFKYHRDIAASQEDLRSPFDHVFIFLETHSLLRTITALVSRVQSVQKDVDKLEAGNQTLQMYIDNLTVQMAKRR